MQAGGDPGGEGPNGPEPGRSPERGERVRLGNYEYQASTTKGGRQANHDGYGTPINAHLPEGASRLDSTLRMTVDEAQQRQQAAELAHLFDVVSDPRRRLSEDDIFTQQQELNRLIAGGEIQGFSVTADGMGHPQHAPGERASSLAIALVTDYVIKYHNYFDGEELLSKAFDHANSVIFEINTNSVPPTECGTALGVTFTDKQGDTFGATVGDIHIYKRDKAKQANSVVLLSKDTSSAWDVAHLSGHPSAFFTSPAASNISAMGTQQGFEKPIHTFRVGKLSPNEQLISCSDGVWGGFDKQSARARDLFAEINTQYQNNITNQIPPDEALQLALARVFEEMNLAGLTDESAVAVHLTRDEVGRASHDNVTAVIYGPAESREFMAPTGSIIDQVGVNLRRGDRSNIQVIDAAELGLERVDSRSLLSIYEVPVNGDDVRGLQERDRNNFSQLLPLNHRRREDALTAAFIAPYEGGSNEIYASRVFIENGAIFTASTQGTPPIFLVQRPRQDGDVQMRQMVETDGIGLHDIHEDDQFILMANRRFWRQTSGDAAITPEEAITVINQQIRQNPTVTPRELSDALIAFAVSRGMRVSDIDVQIASLKRSRPVVIPSRPLLMGLGEFILPTTSTSSAHDAEGRPAGTRVGKDSDTAERNGDVAVQTISYEARVGAARDGSVREFTPAQATILASVAEADYSGTTSTIVTAPAALFGIPQVGEGTVLSVYQGSADKRGDIEHMRQMAHGVLVRHLQQGDNPAKALEEAFFPPGSPQRSDINVSTVYVTGKDIYLSSNASAPLIIGKSGWRSGSGTTKYERHKGDRFLVITSPEFKSRVLTNDISDLANSKSDMSATELTRLLMEKAREKGIGADLTLFVASFKDIDDGSGYTESSQVAAATGIVERIDESRPEGWAEVRVGGELPPGHTEESLLFSLFPESLVSAIGVTRDQGGEASMHQSYLVVQDRTERNLPEFGVVNAPEGSEYLEQLAGTAYASLVGSSSVPPGADATFVLFYDRNDKQVQQQLYQISRHGDLQAILISDGSPFILRADSPRTYFKRGETDSHILILSPEVLELVSDELVSVITSASDPAQAGRALLTLAKQRSGKALSNQTVMVANIKPSD